MFGCGDDWTEDAIWLQLWLDRCRDGVWGCENVWTDVIWLQGWLDRCLRLWKCLNRCHLVTGMTGQVFEVVQMFEQLSFGYTYRDDWTGVWGCGNDWTDVIWLKWWLERGCLRCGNDDWKEGVWGVAMIEQMLFGVMMIGQVSEVVVVVEQMSFGCSDDWIEGVWGCGILAVIERMSFCCNDWTMGMAKIEHAVVTVDGADWTQNKVWVWQWLNRGCHLAAMMIQKRPCVYPVAVTEWRWLKNGCFGTSKIEHRPGVLSVAMIEQRCYLAAMMVDHRVCVGCGNGWAEDVIWIYVSDWS